MKKSNSIWDDILKPTVVLTVICIVVSAALAYTNSITLPIIEKNAALAADSARIELLPEATDGFEPVEIEMENIVEMYKAKNDTGYVITSTANGYGGAIKFMVAYDKDGKIVNLKVLEANETPGLGTKISERAFLDQFIGIDKEVAKADVDMITGVTISSSAALDGLNSALKAFNEKAKGIVVVELTFEEKLNEYFGNMVATTEYTNPDALEFYNSDKGIVVVTEGKGNGIIGDEHLSGLTLKTYTSFDAEGKITGVMFNDASETKGLGTVISEPAFVDTIVGKAAIDDVQIIAGATYSAKGAIEAVNKAIAAYGAIK